MKAICPHKFELLRTVEQLCYQVAHYLLGNERDAVAASQEALIELYRMPIFEAAAESDRQKLARAAATRHALRQARISTSIHPAAAASSS